MKHDMRKGRKTGCPVSASVLAGGVFQLVGGVVRTWVEGRIHDLLCLPYFGGHVLRRTGLVGVDELFGMFEAGRRDK